MDQLLQQIEHNTSQQVAAFIIVSGKGSKIDTIFPEPIVLDERYSYCMALSGLQTYNVTPNVRAGGNDSLTIFDKTSGEWSDIRFATGSYSLEDLNDTLQRNLKVPGSIVLIPDSTTLKCWIEIASGYKVHLKKGDLSEILGFTPQILEAGKHVGSKIVNILNISAINVCVNIVTGSFLDGVRRNIIYTFFPDSAIGSKLVESPYNLLFLPLTVKRIECLSVTLTDQLNEVIDLREETVTCQFIVKRT